MSLKKKGDLTRRGLVMLPNRKIVGKNDGTLQGDVTYKVDRSNEHLLPLIYSAHPDDPRLQLFQQDITRGPLETTTMVASYFGLSSDPTPSVIQHPGGGGRDPIETHPDFATFATEANGATFDEDTGQFLGFYDKTVPEFFGVRSYIVPNVAINLSHWTYRTPNLKKLMTIRSSLTGVRKPEGVGDWLLTGMPYRQVGSVFQITEQYLASGPAGWSKTIYG